MLVRYELKWNSSKKHFFSFRTELKRSGFVCCTRMVQSNNVEWYKMIKPNFTMGLGSGDTMFGHRHWLENNTGQPLFKIISVRTCHQAVQKYLHVFDLDAQVYGITPTLIFVKRKSKLQSPNISQLTTHWSTVTSKANALSHCNLKYCFDLLKRYFLFEFICEC